MAFCNKQIDLKLSVWLSRGPAKLDSALRWMWLGPINIRYCGWPSQSWYLRLSGHYAGWWPTFVMAFEYLVNNEMPMIC